MLEEGESLVLRLDGAGPLPGLPALPTSLQTASLQGLHQSGSQLTLCLALDNETVGSDAQAG